MPQPLQKKERKLYELVSVQEVRQEKVTTIEVSAISSFSLFGKVLQYHATA